MSRKYKPTGKIGLFDKQFANEQLTEMGNPLESINKVIDFEYFRPLLEEKLLNSVSKKTHFFCRFAGLAFFSTWILIRFLLVKIGKNDKSIDFFSSQINIKHK